MKNGSGSRIPDELSPVTREVHSHRSKYHASVFKCEMMIMLALSSDYKLSLAMSGTFLQRLVAV